MMKIKNFFDTKIAAALEASDFDHAKYLFELCAELEQYCKSVGFCHDSKKGGTKMAKKVAKKKPKKSSK